MYPVYCFCVEKAVSQVPASGCLYAMVMFGSRGELRMFWYAAGGGYCAVAERMNAANQPAMGAGGLKK